VGRTRNKTTVSRYVIIIHSHLALPHIIVHIKVEEISSSRQASRPFSWFFVSCQMAQWSVETCLETMGGSKIGLYR